MSRTIIEIKARTNQPDKIRETLKNLGADFRGIDHQIDTYFKVTSGRLKLREGNIENHLIYYQRPDQAGPKQSDVILLPTGPNSPIKAILTQSMGVLAVVDKHREIYFIDNVKFHIDQVVNLGSFMEIEAITNNDELTRDQLLAQCEHYKKLLEVTDSDLLEKSYSDMVLSQSTPID
ncbi:MAG: class IV adenylate cyclase [Patescibacteria group bacterium]